MRRFLKGSTAILRIVDFGGLPVFANAKDTYVCIPLLAKHAPSEHIEVCRIGSLAISDLSSYVSANHYSIPQERLAPEAWALQSNSTAAIFEKILKVGRPLGKHVDGRIFSGIKTGLNEAFEIDTATYKHMTTECPPCRALIHPFLGGQDIRRYFVRLSERYLIAIPCGWTKQAIESERKTPTILPEREAWRWFTEHYGPLASHLIGFADTARRRQDQGEYWWELRPCDYYDVLVGAKIIYPDIAKQPRFHLDTEGTFIRNTAYCLGTDDHYLLGILNSRLFWFSIGNISIPFGVRAGQFRYRLIYQYMEKVPIRHIDFSDPSDRSKHEQMVHLVEQMLSLNQQLAAAKTPQDQTVLQRQIDATDRQIDHLVYQLYGLTEDEIRVVEASGR